ncbi:hypothetical protein HYU45_02710 [Candidatus Daviesbacteria bacterium]|nr:hypothetical protein [Candidatus Daviesbacteria bacterium]
MKKVLKFFIILILVLPFIFFFHTGFLVGFTVPSFQAALFSAVFASALVWPVLKRYVFLLSAILIVGIAPFYIFNIMDWANMLGSMGIGFVLLLVLSYLPDFIKRGYVEKL